MTDEQILKKAIEKALANGWEIEDAMSFDSSQTPTQWASVLYVGTRKTYYKIIFSHSFAKAFWGEERKTKGKWFVGEMWQLHLQQLVLEEEPLKYIEKFL